MPYEHVSLELRPKIVKLSAVRTNEGRLFQTVGEQHADCVTLWSVIIAAMRV